MNDYFILNGKKKKSRKNNLFEKGWRFLLKGDMSQALGYAERWPEFLAVVGKSFLNHFQRMCRSRPKAPSGSRETAEQIGEQTVTQGHSHHLLSGTSKTSGGGLPVHNKTHVAVLWWHFSNITLPSGADAKTLYGGQVLIKEELADAVPRLQISANILVLAESAVLSFCRHFSTNISKDFNVPKLINLGSRKSVLFEFLPHLTYRFYI